MAILVKNKSKFYKQTLLDLWGHHFIYKKVTKAINFIRFIRAEKKAKRNYYKREFIFTYRKRRRFRRHKEINEEFLEKRLLQNFYLVLSYKRIAKYMLIAKRKLGYYYPFFLNFLEQRIFMMAYRTNFITNIFLIRHVIRNGIFKVNGIVRKNYNFVLKPGDIFQVATDYKQLLYNDLLGRYMKRYIFFRVPKYLFMNYYFMFALILRYPRDFDIVHPYPLDVQLASDYSYP